MNVLPCIYCGEEDDVETRAVKSWHHVVCRKCGARGPGADTPEGARESWNDGPLLER